MREKKIFKFISLEDDTMWYSNRELFKSKIYDLASKMTNDGAFYDGFTFWVYTNTVDYELIWKEAAKLLLKPEIVGYKMEYSKKDLENAEYYTLHIPIFGKNDYTEKYDTKYMEVKKCESCGKDILMQISELYIDKNLFRGKDIAITSNHEIVISEKLKNIIEKEKITGVVFKEVKHKEKKIKNDFNVFQMIINFSLPDFDPTTSVYIEPIDYCSYCKTHGILLTSNIKYKKNDILNSYDFNYTKEFFGGGFSGNKSIIITKKVYNLLKQNKIKSCKFDIVEAI